MKHVTQRTTLRLFTAVTTFVVAAVGLTPAVAVAADAPANDAFAAATLIDGASGDLLTSTVGATNEPGEPLHAMVGEASVWFSWTAPTTGIAQFNTFGSGFDTVLAAYTGTAVDALIEVEANDDFGGLQSQIEFDTVAGTTYAIAAAGFQGETGTLFLEWVLAEPPPPAENDDFANGRVLEGEAGSTTGSNELATMETGEPAHALFGTNSVWFTWTAARESLVTFDTVGTRDDNVLAVYTGNAVGDLDLVAEFSHAIDDTRLSFVADGGKTYAVALAGFNGARGPYVLNYSAIDPVPVPANDDYASATVLDGPSGSFAGTTDLMTNEPGEPRHDRWGTRSAWFSWTAPATGAVTFTVEGEEFETILGVYNGPRADALTRITSDDGAVGGDRSRVAFPAQAGTAYAVAVSGQLGRTGAYNLTWDLRQPPPNDMFADRRELVGREGSVRGSSLLATTEAAEPFHAGTGSASLWFSWTAPATGSAVFDTLDPSGLPLFSSFNTVIAAYRGGATDVGSLVAVAANDDGFPPGVPSYLVFPVTEGESYAIAVAGSQNQTGLFNLSWTVAEPLANDAFATPTTLDGSDGVEEFTNVGSTLEPGESKHDSFGFPSVWFAWTAPTDGIVTFDSTASATRSVLAAYAGARLDDLELMAEAGGSSLDTETRITFPARGGQTYAIAAAGRNGARGRMTIDWTFRATPPPANDDFASAFVLAGESGTIDGTNEGATAEPGEPVDGGPRTASVWYSWTAPASGIVTFDTQGSEVDTVLGVDQGDSVDELRFITANGLSCCPHALVQASVTAGETYRVVIFGFDGAQGALTLNWSLRDAVVPANDNLASAVVLGGPAGHLSSTTLGARAEEGEPLQPGGGTASVWYRFTPPTSGAFRFNTEGSTSGEEPTFDTVLAAYTGNRVDGLTEVSANWVPAGLPAQLTLRASQGTTYLLAVSGARGDMGDFHLTWQPVTAPANDNFASATRLRGAAGTLSQSIRFATIEPGEPRHADVVGGASVWFKWQAPSSGRVGFDTLVGNAFADTHMAVYRGKSLATLVPVAANDNSVDGRLTSRLEFDAARGTTYWIAVDTYYGDDRRGFALSWHQAPINDDIADATLLEGAVGRVEGDNLVASLEPGEPARAKNGGASVWYRWHAPADGVASLLIDADAHQPTVSVYRSDLQPIASSGPHLPTLAQVRFAATAGQTYLIAVDGVRADSDGLAQAGPFSLVWRGLPANDDFADATALTGASGMTGGAFGTREIGEPDHGGDGASVWYKWTPPRAGMAYVDTFGSKDRNQANGFGLSNTLLAVYAVEPNGSRRFVAWNDDAGPDELQSEVSFRTEPGVTYAIAVEHSVAFGGGFLHQLNWRTAPPHDDFAAAQVLKSPGGRVNSTNTLATLEAGEPASGSEFGSTVWFRWTAPADGRLEVDVDDAAGDKPWVVDAYAGASVGALTRVNDLDAEPGAAQPTIDFPVTKGQTYAIAVDGGTGDFTLAWHLTSKPRH